MGVLLNLRTDDHITLSVQHIFGRHQSTCNTVLLNLDASRIHASIMWDGRSWILQDSSTNGTFVNDEHILRGVKHNLQAGDHIHFGNVKSETWELIDVEAPKSMLVPVSPGLSTIVLDEITVLPSEMCPEITLYVLPTGEWVCESESGTHQLTSGDPVGVKDKSWCFVEAKTSAATLLVQDKVRSKPSPIKAYFDVSQNEEHVSLKLKMDHHEIDLGQRNHHYLLLLLARKRLADKAAGVHVKEQGWIDKNLLCKMIGLGETHINSQIYRFRKRINSVVPKSFLIEQSVERRRGEIRLSYESLHIEGGFKNELLNRSVA